MLKIVSYLKDRFAEASTWAGIAAAFAGGAAFIPKLIIGSVICGAVAVMMPDYSPEKK